MSKGGDQAKNCPMNACYEAAIVSATSAKSESDLFVVDMVGESGKATTFDAPWTLTGGHPTVPFRFRFTKTCQATRVIVDAKFIAIHRDVPYPITMLISGQSSREGTRGRQGPPSYPSGSTTRLAINMNCSRPKSTTTESVAIACMICPDDPNLSRHAGGRIVGRFSGTATWS